MSAKLFSAVPVGTAYISIGAIPDAVTAHFLVEIHDFAFRRVIWILVGVVGDVLRSNDLGGGAKALWVLGIIAAPWLGVLAYRMLRGEGMTELSLQAVADADKMRRACISGKRQDHLLRRSFPNWLSLGIR